ncbi:MAG: protein-disulfide reductase DsbD domain-containing protein, partial [Gammaproteobacteria bacterium]
MSFSKLVLFCLLSFIYSPLFAQDEHPLLPPDEAFIVKAKAVSSDRLEVTWDIAEGYLLYKKSFRFESKTDPVGLGTPVFPEGKIKHDDMLGDVVHYRD